MRTGGSSPSWWALAAIALGAAAVHACTPSSKESPIWSSSGGATTSSGSGGDLWIDAGTTTGPPPIDAGGVCGNELHKSSMDPPNVYFVLDASGSMQAPVQGATGNRYQVLQGAASKIATQLRHLIKAGAAVFPKPTAGNDCAPGGEVFPVTYDDPAGFKAATGAISPGGGTPTAMTLMVLLPKLAALPGKTVLVLATDGAPNCNANATCDIGECMENLEGCVYGHTCCAEQVNCCTPTGSAGPVNCVDRTQTVTAIEAIHSLGINVYVIGIPGSQLYGSVLTDMALAGGAAQAAYPYYYRVDDLTTISSVLAAAAGSVLPCEFVLDDPPTDGNNTNVYFDETLIPYDPHDGWSWYGTDFKQINLDGAACDKLHSGQVAQVQIVSGCPTQGPQ